MQTVEIYAIAAGGILVALASFSLFPQLRPAFRRLSLLGSKYLTYPHLIHRHRLLGPCSRADILAQAVYVTANVLCFSFKASDFQKAGLRAGTLALVNVIPLFAGFDFGRLADILGLPLEKMRGVHVSAGVMSVVLMAIHVSTVLVQKVPFGLREGKNVFAVIGASSLGAAAVLSSRFFRKWSFEIFLRTHQSLAGLFAYSVWRHLPSDSLLPRLYVYVLAGLFAFNSILQFIGIFYRNGLLHFRAPRASITVKEKLVQVSVVLPKPIRVEPGQYVNLWIPFVSFWAFTQSHPFVVISWSKVEQERLTLLVEPRRGLTRAILACVTSECRLALFSGPHGISAPVNEYENLLMIASGSGIAAHLPYLKRLIQGYSARDVRAKRIHIVWHLPDINIGIAAQSFLNDALDDDRSDQSRILRISVYLEHEIKTEVSFSTRTQVNFGNADFRAILDNELSQKPAGEERRSWRSSNSELESANGGKTLVMVSATEKTRDDLRRIVPEFLDAGVTLLELDYQPDRL